MCMYLFSPQSCDLFAKVSEETLHGLRAFLHSFPPSLTHLKIFINTPYAPNRRFLELVVHWWVKQPKAMWNLPPRCAPKANHWVSSLPLLYTGLPVQKHTAPPIITHIPQNTSPACIPGGRLPACSSIAESWAHAFQMEPRAFGPTHAVLGCAQIREPLPILRMSVWMPAGGCSALGTLHAGPSEEHTCQR